MAESNLIKFKRGTQANLNTLMANKGGEDGCFYLTVDTDSTSHKPVASKLYVGRSTGEIVPVNQGIVTVDTVAHLNTMTANHTFATGDFAYVEGGNILAVYSDNGKWIQINERPNDEFLASLSTAATASSNTATVTTTGTMTAGAPARTTSFDITGTGGIDVTASGSTVTLEGNEYNISAAARSGAAGTYDITLASSNLNTTDAVGFKSANADLGISVANDVLTFEVKNTRNNQVSIDALTGANKGFKVNVKDDEGNTKSGSVDPTIVVGDTNTSTIHFDNGTATLPVYSKTDIDNKFKTLDAMSYKGMVGGTGGTAGADVAEVVATHPHIGDTYKIGEAMNLPSTYSSTGSAISMKAGDIIIATGTEDAATGQITAASLKFDYIPAADDVEDTTYYISTSTHGIELHESGSDIKIGSIGLTAGTAITLTDTVDSGSKNNSIAIAHDSVTRNNTTGTAADNAADGSITIPAVTAVTTNGQGHVTGVETTSFTIDSKAKNLDSVAFATSGSSNNITMTGTFTIKDPFSNATTSKTGTFSIKSDNLTVTGSGSAITINNVWGSF